MQINYILLGQRIRAFRRKKGITQMELAERIDRSAAYMSYVETAYKFCSLDTLVRVANELNVSISCRCASVYIVSKSNDDFPLPLTPVNTTILCFGNSTSTCLRLLVCAFLMMIWSVFIFL